MYVSVVENWLSVNKVPNRDLIAFTKTASCMVNNDTAKKESKVVSGFVKVHYHNKSIEMFYLPRILHYQSVRGALPPFLCNKKPPMVII